MAGFGSGRSGVPSSRTPPASLWTAIVTLGALTTPCGAYAQSRRDIKTLFDTVAHDWFAIVITTT